MLIKRKKQKLSLSVLEVHMNGVFCSDLHIASHAWKSLPQVCGDSYRSYEQIVDYCLNNKVDVLVLGGDVFDAAPQSTDVECFLRGVNKLQEAKIPVLAIQGQHGRNRALPWTSITPYVIDLNAIPYYDCQGTLIAGCDNMSPDEVKEWCSKLDKNVQIVTLHQLARGTVPEVQGKQGWDLDLDWLPDHVGLALLGDYHEPWEFKSKSLLALYNGSICMQSVTEPPEKSFLTFNEKLKIKRIPLKTRPFVKFVITDSAQIKDCICALENAENETLTLIKYDARCEGVNVIADSAKHVHKMFRPLPFERVGGTQQDLSKLQDVSLDGCLGLAVDRQLDEELYSFVLSLLKSKDPKSTVEAHKVKILNG